MFQPNILTFPELYSEINSEKYRQIGATYLAPWKESLKLTILGFFGQIRGFDKIPMAIVTDNSAVW